MADVIFAKKGADFCTPVSNQFLAKLLPGAPGASVKVYLYVFYHFYNQTEGLTLNSVAEALGMMEEDVIEALSYWQNKGQLILDRKDGAFSVDFTICCPGAPEDPSGRRRCNRSEALTDGPASAETKLVRLEKPPVYSPEEMSLYQQNPMMRELFARGEAMMGAPLSAPNLSTLFSFYDYYRMPVEVIEYLLDYCRETDRRSLRYAEKVIQDWCDKGIRTVEEAKAQSELSRRFYPIMKALQIPGGKPSEKDRKMMLKWLDEYKLPLDVICEAAARTLEKAHQPSFPYMDKILTNWQSRGLDTLEKIENGDSFTGGRPGDPFRGLTATGTDYDAYAENSRG